MCRSLATGVVTVPDVATVWGMVENATLSAIALIIIAHILGAAGFLADVASWPLSINNVVNLISTDYLKISFFRYILVMILVNFVAIATGIGVIWFYFDRYIPFTYNLDRMPPPDSVIRDPVVCQWSVAVLGSPLIGYFLTQPLGIPVSSIAMSGTFGCGQQCSSGTD